MSRREYRIGYQVGTLESRKGRVWWHICHTRKRALAFVDWIYSEGRRRNRGYLIVGVEYRDVGKWQPLDGGLRALKGEQ